MNTIFQNLNRIAAAFVICVASATASVGDEAALDALFERLQQEVLPEWEDVQKKIWAIWGRSGSDAMDLLLKRGLEALDAGEIDVAIEHLTALTDHAPEFAEGFNARSTAYFHSECYGLSLADVETTLALNPRHFGAMLGLGAILRQLGYEEKALEAYRAALALNPHRDDIRAVVDRLSAQLDGVEI